MRELKFRAWDGKQMFTEENFDFVVSDYDSIIKLDEYGWTEHGVDCVEQYTGLKDKNGKKIYEGDMIKIEGSDTIYTVEYGRGVWVARFGDESGDNICLFHYVQKDTVLYAEVIGNIHENKELLGGKND